MDQKEGSLGTGQSHLHRRIFELELERVESLLESKPASERMEQLRRASASGTLAFAVLEGERLLFVDPRFAEIVGSERETLEGADRGVLTACMDESCKAALERAYSGSVSVDRCSGLFEKAPGGHRRFELYLRCIDREPPPLILLVLSEIFGQDGGRSVAELASAELFDANRMLQLVLDTIPVRVFWKDLQGRYLGCNTLFARDAGEEHPEDLVGRDDFSLGWRDQAELYRADDFAVMRGSKEKLNYEEPQTTPEGQTSWLRTSKRPLRNAADEVIGVLGTYEDITLQKNQAAQSLHREKLEAIGRLAGGVAHDFNNMLTAILGSLDLMEMTLEISPESRELLETIREASTRAADLTRQLLTFARKQVIQPQRLDPNQYIHRIERLLHRLLGEQVQLRTELTEDPWSIEVDPGQFEQLLVNLAVNARDAMPDGGTLTFETHNLVLDDPGGGARRSGPYLQIVVRDTGEGIDEAVLQHLFEPFFTTKDTSRGTGLGLAICHGIVTRSDGFIEVDSVLGEGTRFEIFLPRDEAAAEAPAEPRVQEPERRGSETVLVVEDEESVRRVCVVTLQSQGYRVLEADSVAEGLRIARAHEGEIELLLSDVVLPDGKGPQLARELLAENSALKVLFTSGYNEEIAASDASQEPGIHFLQKPYRRSQLSEALRRIFDD